MTDPTIAEISACSDAPARFQRMMPTALEVIDHAAAHGGRLPSYVYELTDAKWLALSDTLRELDLIEWARRRAA